MTVASYRHLAIAALAVARRDTHLLRNVDRWRCAPHPVSKRWICGGNATGSLKRTDFGMKWGVPVAGDDVRIVVTFEAFRD